MKVQIKVSDKKRSTLTSLGVPSSLLYNASFNTDSYIKNATIYNAKEEASAYSIAKQNKVLDYLCDTDFNEQKLFCFESPDEYRLIRSLALYFMGKAMLVARDNLSSTQATYPKWLYITASSYTSMPRISRYPQLLVLDNLATNSTSANRTERVRDIVNLYSNRTILLLFSGNGSIEWCRDVIGVRPNGLVRFTSKSAVQPAASIIKL